MKIKAKITLLFNGDGLSLQIHDEASSETFIDVQLTPKQTCLAMSRLSHTPVAECEVHNLDRVGKKMEMQHVEFPIKCDSYQCDARKKAALKAVKDYTPEGWEADDYYDSQNSFFKIGEQMWARTTLRRWVEAKS